MLSGIIIVTALLGSLFLYIRNERSTSRVAIMHTFLRRVQDYILDNLDNFKRYGPETFLKTSRLKQELTSRRINCVVYNERTDSVEFTMDPGLAVITPNILQRDKTTTNTLLDRSSTGGATMTMPLRQVDSVSRRLRHVHVRAFELEPAGCRHVMLLALV